MVRRGLLVECPRFGTRTLCKRPGSQTESHSRPNCDSDGWRQVLATCETILGTVPEVESEASRSSNKRCISICLPGVLPTKCEWLGAGVADSGRRVPVEGLDASALVGPVSPLRLRHCVRKTQTEQAEHLMLTLLWSADMAQQVAPKNAELYCG
jgi:hypothetical protein